MPGADDVPNAPPRGAAALFFFGWFHPVNMFDNSFLAISTAFVGGACMAFMALFIGLRGHWGKHGGAGG